MAGVRPTPVTAGRTAGEHCADPTGPVALPDGFLFGVATAGFQVEGGYNGPGEPANNWARWEAGGRIEPSGNACDFWLHPEEALDRAAGDGVRRLPALGRVGPARARRRASFDDDRPGPLRRASSTPATTGGSSRSSPCTTSPTRRGWARSSGCDADSPERFAAHVARVVPALAGRCRTWITINEPNIVALMGWVRGRLPAGAHRGVRRGVHRPGQPAGRPRAGLPGHPRACSPTPGSPSTPARRRSTSTTGCSPTCSTRPGRRGGPGRHRRLDRRAAGAARPSGCPPGAPVEAALRRLFAAVSPYGTRTGGDRCGRGSALDAGPPGARRRLRRARPTGPSTPPGSTGTTRSPPTPCGCPGHRTVGGRQWEPSRAIWDVARRSRRR